MRIRTRDIAGEAGENSLGAVLGLPLVGDGADDARVALCVRVAHGEPGEGHARELVRREILVRVLRPEPAGRFAVDAPGVFAVAVGHLGVFGTKVYTAVRAMGTGKWASTSAHYTLALSPQT